jgi:hypothetical protein
MNQPRKGPFHLYSLSPHSPQFQQLAVSTISSLSGFGCDCGISVTYSTFYMARTFIAEYNDLDLFCENEESNYQYLMKNLREMFFLFFFSCSLYVLKNCQY